MNTPSSFDLVTDVDPDDHKPELARVRLDNRLLPVKLHNHREAARHYRPSRALRIAINTALAVNAPLLITGEPGTGKTQVAYYLGWYFDTKVFSYQVRSTSTARDLKYDFDAVGYLRYAQLREPGEKPKTRSNFLTEQALWQAYEYPDGTPIMLIDEIDKAPRDFPNDLLLELDQHRFRHPFEERDIKPSNHPPVVIITSNAERRLPDAFLRRCVLHSITLDDTLIDRVVAARDTEFPRLEEATRREAVARFKEIRRIPGLNKPPSTAELLTWFAVLSARDVKATILRDASSLRDLPGLEVLIKDGDDFKKL